MPTIENKNVEKKYLPQYFAIPSDIENGISLKELVLVLWRDKILITAITFIFVVIGISWSLTIANTYRSEATLSISSDSSGGGLSSMASQVGGLATLAGINLGGNDTDDKAISLATLKSRMFLNEFIENHNLLVPLLAAKDWNSTTGELVIDPELYDIERKEWIRKVEPGQSVVPTDWEAYKAFKEILAVEESKDNGLITLSITHFSPIIAQQWNSWLVSEFNSWMKEKSLSESQRNIKYLESQLVKTNFSDMRQVFFQLIEEQMKKLMLAEVEVEFVFKVIDPAIVPEEKSGPKRALICILMMLLGIVVGIIGSIVKYLSIKKV